jgi:predicted amidohydrolase YtcJ
VILDLRLSLGGLVEMTVSFDCDLALFRGNVVTVDPIFSIRSAVGIRGNRIVAVGSDDQIRSLIGPRTTVVDLKGKTVLPGINDSHAHTALWAGTRPPFVLDLSYPNVRSVAEILAEVKAMARSLPPSEWVRGTGWDGGYLDECLRDPGFRLDRRVLDSVAPQNPIALADFSLHALWVNSKALELAGIGRGTPDPPGGVIERDAGTGEPTGMLIEFAATSLVMGLVPPWTRAQKRQAVSAALDDMNALGITSMTEPALGPGGDAYQGGLLGSECIGVYQDLLDDERLKVRVNVLYLFGEYGANSLADLQGALPQLGFHSDFGNEKLKIGGIKIFADGIPPNRTAWVSREYVRGGHGSLALPGETDEERVRELEEMIRFAHGSGFQVGVHSVGDLAIGAAIAGFAKAETEDPKSLRHYLMHVDFITPEQAATVARHGFGVNITPAMPWTISDMNVDIVGLEQVKREWPYRLVANAGCHLAASSDAPCTYPSWLQGVQSAVLRESKATGTVYSPDQCLTLREAIRMYTIGGAWQDRQEHIKGSIEPGKLADLCVIDQDILSVDHHDISKINNVMTIMDGRVVWADE